MATNSDGEPLPKPLTTVKLLRELAEVLDKHGDLPVVAPNLETTTWADVEDVVVKDGRLRIMFDVLLPGLTEPDPSERRLLEDEAWGSVWLYGSWKHITTKMVNTERELAADAVARWSERIEREDQTFNPINPEHLRWWRY